MSATSAVGLPAAQPQAQHQSARPTREQAILQQIPGGFEDDGVDVTFLPGGLGVKTLKKPMWEALKDEGNVHLKVAIVVYHSRVSPPREQKGQFEVAAQKYAEAFPECR
jgi:hypothetical protein